MGEERLSISNVIFVIGKGHYDHFMIISRSFNNFQTAEAYLNWDSLHFAKIYNSNSFPLNFGIVCIFFQPINRECGAKK